MGFIQWLSREVWEVQVVISSAFESSIGLGQYAHLAAALDAAAGSDQPSAHGLGTAVWFNADVTPQPLQPSVISDAQVSSLPFLLMDSCVHRPSLYSY